jgi:MscS family membrane protein
LDITQYWSSLTPDVRNMIIRVGLAVVVLLLIWILRRLLTAIVVAPLRRFAKRSEQHWDDVLLSTAVLPARFLIIALGLAIGARILQIDTATNTFVDHLIRTFIIIAVLMAAYRAVDALTPSSARLFRFTGLTVSERLLPFLRTATKMILLAFSLVIVIQEWGYDVSGLVAGLGLGGLAFSLAAQDTVANLFGFTTIVGDQPFIVGEFIKTPDVEGIVERVGVRSTRLRQLDQGYVTVPNSKLASSAILNWSRLSKRRLNTILSLKYDARPDQIRTLCQRIRDLLNARDSVQKDSIVVYFIEFGESGLNVLVRCYLLLPDWGEFTAEQESIYLEIFDIVEEVGLSLAFPSRSVYIEQNSPTIEPEELDS